MTKKRHQLGSASMRHTLAQRYPPTSIVVVYLMSGKRSCEMLSIISPFGELFEF